MAVIKEYDRASGSLLQKRLKIGYARAARIIDQLEARGYVGPSKDRMLDGCCDADKGAGQP